MAVTETAFLVCCAVKEVLTKALGQIHYERHVVDSGHDQL